MMMANHFVTKEFCIFFFQTEAVIFFILIPVFQSDNQIDILGLSDTLYTEQSLDIHDTDTSQLDKMSRNIRCRSDKCLITDSADLNYIIT